VYIHFPNYYIVWKHGIAASKIIDYRFGVVRRAKSDNSLPFYHELIGEDFSYQPQYRDIGWLLVRGSPPQNPDPNLQHFTLFRKSGPWSIYKNEKMTGI
jgi:hypothetical protein